MTSIGLAAPIFDLQGNLLLSINLVDSQLINLLQRVSKSDTLAGGSVIRTKGYYETNRTIQVKVQLNKEDEDKLLYIFKNYPYLYFSSLDGFYLVVIESMEKEKEKDQIVLSIVIKEKMT